MQLKFSKSDLNTKTCCHFSLLPFPLPFFSQKDILSVKNELHQAVQKHKELVSTNAKLNGLVKIGQDALRAEQEVVKHLQQRLAEKDKVFLCVLG